MRIISYDTEIMSSIDETIDGWDGARRGDAGISCAVLYDTSTRRSHIYCAGPWHPDYHMRDLWDPKDLDALLSHLNSADLLIGFNNIAFDTPALQGFTESDILPQQYDILHEVWAGLGGRRYKGFGLDALCTRLGLGSKNGENGESAPLLYKSGRFGRLIDYCTNDVHLTRRLANYIHQHGYVTTPEGETFTIRRPDTRV